MAVTLAKIDIMNKATVLTVDDDENLQIVLTHYLESEGYGVLCATSGQDLKEKLKTVQPHVVLLDLVLPDTDGFSLLGHIRSQYSYPVIVVSGKSDTTEKVVCLEMGADDYMTKPFEMRELSARIKAVLRRAAELEQAVSNSPAKSEESVENVAFGSWVLDRAKLQVFDANGKSADLTTGEFKLLDTLIKAGGRVLGREFLFDVTRESDYDSYDRAVDIQIGRLRKKLQDDPKESLYIKTVRGAGYMFIAKTSVA